MVKASSLQPEKVRGETLLLCPTCKAPLTITYRPRGRWKAFKTSMGLPILQVALEPLEVKDYRRFTNEVYGGF